MNKKGLFYESFLLIAVIVTLSLLLISKEIHFSNSQIAYMSNEVLNLLRGQSKLEQNNYLLREALTRAVYKASFKLASSGGIINSSPFGKYWGTNIILFHRFIDDKVKENSFKTIVNNTLIFFLNRSLLFLPLLEKGKSHRFIIEEGRNSSLFVGVIFPQHNIIYVPSLSLDFFSTKKSAVKVSSLTPIKDNLRLVTLPNIFICSFSGDCPVFFVTEKEAQFLKFIYFLYYKYGIVFQRKLLQDSSHRDLVCFSNNSLNVVMNPEAREMMKLLKEFKASYEKNQKVENPSYFCIELKKSGPLQNSFFDSFFKGVLIKPFAAYKFFDYNYFNRSRIFESIIEEIRECLNKKVEPSSISFYPHNYLADCLSELQPSFQEKGFEVFDYAISGERNKERLYFLGDTFSMIEESSSNECKGPEPLNPLLMSFAHPERVVINSTHFLLYDEDGKSIEAKVQKLNGFSHSNSPQIEAKPCVTDLLGKPLSLSDIGAKNSVSLTEVLSLSKEGKEINWYRDKDGKVCIAPEKFSEASKLELLGRYVKEFYKGKLVKGALEPFLGDFVSLASNLLNVLSSHQEKSPFCGYLMEKGFYNVEEVFPECKIKGEISEVPTDFFLKLDSLKKQKCLVAKRWYVIGGFDKTFLYPQEIKSNSSSTIEIFHPLFVGAFFTE